MLEIMRPDSSHWVQGSSSPKRTKAASTRVSIMNNTQLLFQVVTSHALEPAIATYFATETMPLSLGKPAKGQVYMNGHFSSSTKQ